MRFLFRAILLMAVAISVTLMNCTKEPSAPEKQEEPGIIIADNVVVIEQGGPVSLESIDSTTFTFSYTGDAPDIETGDVFVGSEDGGYFRKASAVTFQDNQLIIETEDAALVEAILQGSFHIIDTLDWNSAKLSGDGDKQGKIAGGDGIELLPNGTIEFSNLPIFSDDYLNIFIAEGSLSFTPAIDIGGDIDFPGILREFHALATGTVDVYADFYANSSADYTISSEITIPGAQYEFGPYFVSISGFPLWYSFELSLVAGFDYASNAAMETEHGFRNFASLTVGAQYENSDWEAVFDPTLELTAREVIWDRSENITLKCYIKPTLTMRFYSYPGPYIDAGPYLELDAEVDYPQWQYDLKAGLESSLGIRVRFLSFELVDFNKVLYANDTTIASESGTVTGSPPDQPSNPSPPDSSDNQPINIFLEWECFDPDGDPLTYDVYFGTNSYPPLVSSNQTQEIYEPGQLQISTTYYWKIVAFDGQDSTVGDIWNFSTIEEQSGVYLVGSFNTPHLTDEIYVSGNYVYVADGFSGLLIINITNPSDPTLEGSYDTPGAARGVYVLGDYAYVVAPGNGLQIVNISDPSNPSLAGTCAIPDLAQGVYVYSNYAYVAAYYSLQIVNISNPSSPVVVGSYNTPGLAWASNVSGDYAYIADTESGLQIIDISNPSNPSFAGSYDTPGYAKSLYVSGHYAYVADMGSGLQIINTSNPSNPTLEGSYDTQYQAHGVYVSGNYAHVADGNSGLQIINISNPSNPSFAGSHDAPDNAVDVHVSGNYVYVADYNFGFQIFRFVL